MAWEMSPIRYPLAREGQALAKALLRRVDQGLGLGRDLPHREGPRHVGLVPVQQHRAVNGNDLPFPQDHRFRGDAVHHHVVRRRADGARKSLISLFGRNRAVRADDAFGYPVELGRGHTGADGALDRLHGGKEHLSSPAHLLNLGLRFVCDHLVAPKGRQNGLCDFRKGLGAVHVLE